jgi:hypothetical protein
LSLFQRGLTTILSTSALYLSDPLKLKGIFTQTPSDTDLSIQYCKDKIKSPPERSHQIHLRITCLLAKTFQKSVE